MREPTQIINRWIKRPVQRPDAGWRLFCFPYAGGGASLFARWPQALPMVEVCLVQLPGREERLLEPAIANLGELLDAFAVEVTPYLDRPIVLFGHSMGALLAYEWARRLTSAGNKVQQLFISGRRAPQVAAKDVALHKLPDAAFIHELRRLNGTPEEVLSNKELMACLLPTLRADFALCETYTYAPTLPLTAPITVLGGLHDATVPHAELDHWRVETTASFRFHTLPGDHFFIRERAAEVLAIVAETLTESTAH